jgi:hypothetical protein
MALNVVLCLKELQSYATVRVPYLYTGIMQRYIDFLEKLDLLRLTLWSRLD